MAEQHFEVTRIEDKKTQLLFEGEIFSSTTFGFDWQNVRTPTAINQPHIQVWCNTPTGEQKFSNTFGFSLNDYVAWLLKSNYIIEFKPIDGITEQRGSFTIVWIDEMSRDEMSSEHQFSELWEFDLFGAEMISYFLDTEPVLDNDY